MKKKVYNKCLSLILCSSLILSPVFATNEQFMANENNVKIEEQSGKPSFVKRIFNKLNNKYVKVGAVISTFVLCGIIDINVEMRRQRRLEEERAFRQAVEGFVNWLRPAGTGQYGAELNVAGEQSTADQGNRRFEGNAEEIRQHQLNEWQDVIHTRKGIKIFEKFFNFVKINAKWRNKHNGAIYRDALVEDARTLWPINDQIDDQGRPSAIFAEYIDSRWNALDEQQRNLLRNEIERIKELSEQNNYKRYKEYRDRELAGNRFRGLSRREREEYERLKTKDNEVLGVIENLVNSHENHCSFRLKGIINDVAVSLDSLENANEDCSNETATTSDEMKDYAITLFRQRLYDKAFEGSAAASAGSETVMIKDSLDEYFGDRFGIDGRRSGSSRWATDDQRMEIRERIVEKFDLDLLRETISNENNGIFKKFPAGSIEGYKNKCMENEVSFKEYCFYANKNADDFKVELEELINCDEGSRDSDEAKELREWANGEKNLSFNELKDDAVALDTLCQFRSTKETDLVDMFPGLAPKNTEKDVANVLMIADMVKNGYFVVDESKIDEAIYK